MSRIKIIWQEGQHNGELIIPSTGSLLIGRDANANIQLTDGRVSRQHARLESKDDLLTIHNLSRSNPVLVNAQRLEPNQSTQLNPGDSLHIGHVHMQIVPTEPGYDRSAGFIVKCPNCKREVALSHKDCPHCGYHLAGGVTLI